MVTGHLCKVGGSIREPMNDVDAVKDMTILLVLITKVIANDFLCIRFIKCGFCLLTKKILICEYLYAEIYNAIWKKYKLVKKSLLM